MLDDGVSIVGLNVSSVVGWMSRFIFFDESYVARRMDL